MVESGTSPITGIFWLAEEQKVLLRRIKGVKRGSTKKEEEKEKERRTIILQKNKRSAWWARGLGTQRQ